MALVFRPIWDISGIMVQSRAHRKGCVPIATLRRKLPRYRRQTTRGYHSRHLWSTGGHTI